MEENILTVDYNGEDLNIVVIDILDCETNGKKYIVYMIEGTEDVLMSILEETDTTYTLKSIDDEEEAQMVETMIENLTLAEGE